MNSQYRRCWIKLNFLKLTNCRWSLSLACLTKLSCALCIVWQNDWVHLQEKKFFLLFSSLSNELFLFLAFFVILMPIVGCSWKCLKHGVNLLCQIWTHKSMKRKTFVTGEQRVFRKWREQVKKGKLLLATVLPLVVRSFTKIEWSGIMPQLRSPDASATVSMSMWSENFRSYVTKSCWWWFTTFFWRGLKNLRSSCIIWHLSGDIQYVSSMFAQVNFGVQDPNSKWLHELFADSLTCKTAPSAGMKSGHEWTNEEWLNEWMNEWMDGWTNEWNETHLNYDCIRYIWIMFT